MDIATGAIGGEGARMTDPRALLSEARLSNAPGLTPATHHP